MKLAFSDIYPVISVRHIYHSLGNLEEIYNNEKCVFFIHFLFSTFVQI